VGSVSHTTEFRINVLPSSTVEADVLADFAVALLTVDDPEEVVRASCLKELKELLDSDEGNYAACD
jgi:hypothetical protein